VKSSNFNRSPVFFLFVFFFSVCIVNLLRWFESDFCVSYASDCTSLHYWQQTLGLFLPQRFSQISLTWSHLYSETTILISKTSHLEDVTRIYRRRASAQWLSPPVASDYVCVVYFSWRDASWRQQSLADMSFSPVTDKIDWHTLFDSLRVAWSRISSSYISITPSKCLSCIQVSVSPFRVFPFQACGQSKVSCDSASLWLCGEVQTRRLTNTYAHTHKRLKNFIDAFTCSLW